MSLSKKSRRGIAVFNNIQLSIKRVSHVLPKIDLHTKALKLNERFDIEKKQKESRYERIKSTRS